jgi:energy-coupling factor transport system substrate-specific component
MGLTSAWLPNMSRRSKLEVAILVAWSMLWGMGFGFVMNIWFWPYILDPAQASMHWEPGLGALEAFKRYLAFYAITSSWWDVARAAGNAAIILAFGHPLLRLLRRFGRRFTFATEGQA